MRRRPNRARSSTVVVSPLIALMKDQVDALRASGVRAAALNSSLGPEETREQIRYRESLPKLYSERTRPDASSSGPAPPASAVHNDRSSRTALYAWTTRTVLKVSQSRHSAASSATVRRTIRLL